MTVSQLLRTRVSIRAYTNERPTLEQIREILDTARWSPSGGNMQPWKVIVVTGHSRDKVCALAHRTLNANPEGEDGDYPVLPPHLPPQMRSRRSAVAAQRFAALGIRRDDKAARAAAVARNYDFWGAPVGLFFVTHRHLERSQWAHLGMFIQSVVLVAQELGLASCVQEAWAMVRETLRRYFGLPDDEVIYCGMALGYADWSQPINRVRSTRQPIASFARFSGFADIDTEPGGATPNG